MPKSKFDAFYYGVGLKLDEASVDEAGKKIEGRLNKVVDGVKDSLKSITDAASKGMKDIDTKGLVGALVEAQKELGNFNDFNPKELKGQIGELEQGFKDLQSVLGDVADSIKGFKDLGGFIADISTRLSKIEILTPKLGKDALKKDVSDMKNVVADLYKMIENGQKDISTDIIDVYMKKIKDGMASIKASGNSMELFADKDMAKEFITVTNLLRKMGDPVESLRSEFYELSSTFKAAFEGNDSSKIFKNIGFQIEETTQKLKQAQNAIKPYEDRIASLRKLVGDWQKDIDTSDLKLLDDFNTKTTAKNFDAIIEKIKEYQKTIYEIDDAGDLDYQSTMNKMLALIQSVEGAMSSMDKQKATPFLTKWADVFDGASLESGKKLSVSFLEDYREGIKYIIDEIKAENENEYQTLEKEIRKHQDKLYMLLGREEEKKPKKTSKNIVKGTAANIEAKIRINEVEWAKTINDVLLRLESKGKIKPIKIPVATTEGKILKQVQEQAKKIREMALANPKDEGKTDIKSFNHKFKNFLDNLKDRKAEIAAFLKDEWQPALKDAFTFKMELLGIDNKSVTKNIADHMLPTVDAINTVLEGKPLIFHSNIDTLVEEIQSKLQDVKIDIGAGNINVNPAGLSNANIIINGIVGASGVPTQVASTPQISEPAPSTHTSKQSDTTTDNNKSSKQSKTTKSSKAKTVRTAEEQMAEELAAGKKIIEYYLRLARWAKALGPIAEGVDREITENDFKNSDTIIRNKKIYTKDSIGTVIKGRSIELSDLDAFIAEYEQSKSEEDRQLFSFLKDVIDVYKSNKQKFDSLLNELSDSSVTEGYGSSDNKTEFLTTSITNMLRNFAPMKKSAKQLDGMPTIYEFSAQPKTKAGMAIQESLKNVKDFEFLVGQLYNTSDTNEQWEILQKIIPELLKNLKNREGTIGRPAGKNYTQFEQLLQLIQAYVPMSNSLQTIGQEASKFMRGSKVPQDKYRKEWDKTSNRWHYTNEKIGVKQGLVESGLRQEIQGLAAVFIDEFGNAIAGVNSGKNIAQEYLGIGNSTSFYEIIKFLTGALGKASVIAVDASRKGMKGYEGVTKWNPDEHTKRATHINDYKFTTVTTEKGELEERIRRLQQKIGSDEKQLAELEAKLGKTNLSESDKGKLLSLPSTITSKQSDLTSHKSKATSLANEIDGLKQQINNPEVLYEDIVTQLLTHKETLYSLQKILSQKQQTAKSDAELAEIEKLKSQILEEGNIIKNLEASSSTAKRDVSDKKSTDLILKEEEQLNKLKEQLNKLKEESQYKTNKTALDALIQERESIIEQINQIKNKINLLPVRPRDAVAEGELIKQRDALGIQASELTSQIQSFQSNVSPYEDEVNYLSNLIAAKESYIVGLKDIGIRERVKTSDELNKTLNEKLGELTKTTEEISKLENEISSLESQLMQIGDENTRQIIVDIISQIGNLKNTIAHNKNRLSTDKQSSKDASKDVKYSKSYEEAVADLPYAQANKAKAEQNAGELRLDYDGKQLSFLTEVISKQQSGAITKEQADAMMQLVPKIGELNQKLIDGKLAYQDYLQTVENAYILMTQAATEEAKANARADAKKLADATELVRKYREEEKRLKNIIKTQKPAEQPIIPIASKSDDKPQKSTSSTTQDNRPVVIGGTPSIEVSGTPTLTMGGNIVANIDGSGLAKDTTVRAIYDLLSVKKNGDVNPRIEEIKKAISVKEEEARAKAEEARRAKEAEAAKKAKEEEARKAEVSRKKVAEQTAKVQVEAEKKKVEESKKQVENEKKKTEESKKQTDSEKKKTTESKKQSEQETKKVAATKQQVSETKKKSSVAPKATDELLDISGKSGKELWKAYLTTSKEVQLGQRVFREHSIKLKNGSVTGVVRGLNARSPGLETNNLDTYGHLHPRDSLYSNKDFNGMKSRRANNASYNTDFLLTPNYIYKLDELKNASINALEDVQKKFKQIEQLKFPSAIELAAKESSLHYFAQQNGVQFNKMSINPDNTVTDITKQMSIFSKDVLDKIIELGKLNEQIRLNFQNKQSNTDEHKDVVSKRDTLRDELHKDELYGQIAPKNSSEYVQFIKEHNAMAYKSIDATLIQEAVDFGFDLSLFVDTFKDLFMRMESLDESIPKDSSLAKIKTYIDAIGMLPANATKRKDLIKEMTPYVYDAFKKNNTPALDDRAIMLNPLKEIAKFDSSGQINRIIQKFAPQTDDANVDFANMSTDDDITARSIEELKAELSRLEAIRDAGEVDPRFATAEKQDVIIDLLKNGIKVSGKADGKTGSSDGKKGATRTVKVPSTGKVDTQFDMISNLTGVNTESALYKRYMDAKSNFDDAYKNALAQGKNLTKDEADKVRALATEVTRLGRKIIDASSALEQFKSRGGQAFESTANEAKTLKDEMLELAYQNAAASKMLLSDISYDEVTQKMTYSLTDLEGNVTKVSMAYNELFDSILTMSDKTTNSVGKIYKTIEGEMTNRIGVNDAVKATPALGESKEYHAYADAYRAMMDAQDALRVKGELATKEEKNNLISLTREVANTRDEFEKLAKASSEFSSKVGNNFTTLDPNFDTTILSDKMKEFVLNSNSWTKSQRDMIEQTWNFKDAQNEATYSVVDGKKQLASMSVIFDEGTRRIGQYTVETKKYQTGFEKFMDSLAGKWQEVARYLMSFGSLYRVWAVLKQGVQYVREVDSALTELKKVTDETEESYERFLNTAAKTADKVGSTIKEVVSSTADWARIGYSLQDAATLAESTSILLNVSEFQSIDEATSALTSTLQAFGYTAQDSMQVVDVMNEVGNSFAVSSDGIATALQDSASSLMAANNSYQEAVALIAAANRVVQDPNSVGAALRTISLRLRGTSTEELEEAGEDTDGAIASKSKLRSKIKGYTGIDILTDSGAYKSTYEILLEISKVWDDLTDMDRAGLLEMIAGKTRSNTAAAILSNTKDLEKAYKSAMEAEGSALAENEKYLDSIQGRIDLFNNSIQTMWNNTLDSDAIKFFVNVGTQLVKWVDNLGLIKTLFMGIGTILIQKYFKGDLIGGLFGGLSTESIPNAKAHLQTLRDEVEKAQAAFDANHSKDNEKYLNRAKAKHDQYKNSVGPQIEEYDKLEEKMTSLKESRQALLDKFEGATISRDKNIPIIDNEISDIQNKIDIAKQQLSEAKSADWDYYKKLGSTTPAKDRDNRIAEKTQEIKEYEEALNNLQVKKQELESTPDTLVEDISKVDAEIKQVEVCLNSVGSTGLTVGQKIKAGFNTAKKAVLEFGKEILKSMAWSMAITAVLESITIIGGWIGDVWNYFKPKTFEDLQEELEHTKSELSNVESEISSLNTELDNTNDRIEELMSQGSLTYVEQEELTKLKSATTELKAQIALNETLKKSLQTSANSQSIDATKAYLDTSFMSDQTKTERQEEYGDTGEGIGKVIGTAGGATAAAIIGAKVTGAIGTFFAGPAGTAVGIALGSLIGGWIGKVAGEGIAGASYDSEETVGEAMDNMIAKRKELKSIQDEALADKDIEAYNDATEALNTYDAQMAKHISQIQENYNAMDWETATDEQKKTVMEYADWLDKYSISMGADGAKSSAIARIFGDEASDDVKRLKSDIEDAMAAAKKDGTDPVFDFKEEIEDIDGLTQRLYDMGLTVTDVKYYFLDLAKAEKEAEEYSTFDTVKEINSLSSGVKSLKDAFGEIQEEGYVSTETLVELEKTFGGLGDSWKNFVDTVATGTGSIKEATEAINELLEVYLGEQLAKGPMSAEEQLKTIMLLQQLGVKNAKEYVDAMQKAQVVNAVAEEMTATVTTEEHGEYGYLHSKKATGKALTSEEEERYNELNDKIYPDMQKVVAKYESEYNVDLTEEEERLLIEKAITAQKAEQAALEASTRQREYENAIYNKEVAQDKVDDLQSRIDYYLNNPDVWQRRDVDGAYIGVAESNKGATISAGAMDELIKPIQDQLKVAQGELDAIDVPAEVDVDGLTQKAEDAKNDLEKAFDDMGLKVDVQLTDPSELVDDIQSVYDSLSDAAKEYAENGGQVSVDTFQELLKLEPKYLAMLYNEHGQITLNKEALLQVAQARLYDMTQKQIDSIITNATNAAKAGEIDKLKQLTEVLYGAGKAQDKFNTSAMAGLAIALQNPDLGLSPTEQGNYVKAVQAQVDAAIGAYNTSAGSLETLKNTLSSSGNTAKAEAEDAFQKAMDYWENRIGAEQSRFEQVQNEIDLLEKQGKIAGKEYYDEQIASENRRLDLLQQQKAEAQKFLKGFKEGSDEWWDAANQLNDIEGEIDDVTLSIQDLRDAQAEVDWKVFDEATDRFSKLHDELDTIRELIAPNGEEDWFDDEGMFTDKGSAYLASYITDLQFYEGELEKVNEKLKDYSLPYAGNEEEYKKLGIDSEQKLYDAREKLIDQQYDIRKAQSDTQQSVADMHESQIDAVEEYTNKLVESYNDYIDVVKEALDAERDLYEFKKDIQKQTKDIASLERRIASLSGSDNAADIAERRKLEAQLAEQREDLDDKYYSHAKDAQQQALEDEATAYEESMNKFIDGLRTSLKSALLDMEGFIGSVTLAVMTNAPTIEKQYNDLGITLDGAIIDPWTEAANAITKFGGVDGLGVMNSWVTEGGAIYKFDTEATKLLKSPWEIGQKAVGSFTGAVSSAMDGVYGSIQTNVSNSITELNKLKTEINKINTSDVKPPVTGGGDDTGVNGGEQPKTSTAIETLQKIINQFFGGMLKVDGKLGPLTKLAIKAMQLALKVPLTGEYDKATYEALKKWLNARPVGSWFKEGGLSIPAPTKMYASGTMGTKQSGFAITDESWIGEEITLAAGKNGQLQYLKKGSAVMPADISANLVEWGKLNPDMMNIGGTPNLNMISNAINKPEFNLSFEALVKADRIDEGTLPEIKKYVTQEINSLVKQMNYAIKGYSR